MFNFFKKKDRPQPEPEPEPEEDESKWHTEAGIDACIVYYIKDGGSPCVDIELPDYSDRSVDSLCNLLCILGTDNFYVETLNVMKEGFVIDGRDDLFTRVAIQVASFAKDLDEKGEGPCFKPSDVL